ncbi:DUF4235 domain-containing protein [Calidifontibacter sp. DB0510]|uniref:DUF4235 domain-containing protein n=1 Tax=Metallococcus carri TaxID=1656884 RepID=A0A967B7K3_9MICO|nr:DUF4235 domain-containing protein [Metallococcus carri]NHN57042.1 DUF4235 domain-containing protein [Metallococcus carri]NOP39089.1 DUF4235 domain-containing protein [Calidifontibacter sp. DB2511S]
MGSVVWKVLSLVANLLAGKAATTASRKGWQVATGKSAPDSPHDPKVTTGEAVAWTIISGALIAGVRLFAQRKAMSFYTKSAGAPPPPVQKKQKKTA